MRGSAAAAGRERSATAGARGGPQCPWLRAVGTAAGNNWRNFSSVRRGARRERCPATPGRPCPGLRDRTGPLLLPRPAARGRRARGSRGAPVWEEGREGAVKGRAGRRGEGGGQRFACFEPGTGGCGGLRQAGCQRGEGAGALPISHRYFTPPPVNPTEKTSGSSSSDLGFAGGKFGF